MATTIRPMATDIHTFEQLNALTRINNVPIQVIERRARPGTERGNYSTGGFIALQDRFVDVLKADWNTVAALGVTHVEIAEHLDKIVRHPKSASLLRPDCFSRHTNYMGEMSYDVSSPPNNRLSAVVAEMNKAKSIWARFSQIISICPERVSRVSGIFDKLRAFFESWPLIFRRIFYDSSEKTRLGFGSIQYCGFQEDLFEKPNQTHEALAGRGNFHVRPWSQDYVLFNFDTCESITIPEGLVEYIRRFGFYEGNVPYRVDPLKLVSVITGTRVADLQAYARSRSS